MTLFFEDERGREAAAADLDLLSGQSRRRFLTGVAAVGAAALLPAMRIAGAEPGGAAPGAQGSAAGKKPRRVDVHHHPSMPRARGIGGGAAQLFHRAGPG